MGTTPIAMAGPCNSPSLNIAIIKAPFHVIKLATPCNFPCSNLPEKYFNDHFKNSWVPVLFLELTNKLKLHVPCSNLLLSKLIL